MGCKMTEEAVRVKCPIDGDLMTEKDCEGCQLIDKCWTVERRLVILMKGRLKEINRLCEEIGELTNKYALEVKFL